MENHRNYAENTRKSHRIHTEFREFPRNSVNSHGIRSKITRNSHDLRMEIAQKSRKSRKNTEIMRNSNGILSEIARKSRKITEIPRKICGNRTELTRNSHENYTKFRNHTEFIGFRMGPRPRGHPSSPRRVPPPSLAKTQK